jgi:hypothetical protein
MALDGPSAKQVRGALDGGFDRRLDGNEPSLGKPGNENLGVLIAGNLPGLGFEPELSISRCRKMEITTVKELRGR